MTEDEKVVMDILKAISPIDLTDLKEQTGLSNKKWDKAIKGLTKNKLARWRKLKCALFVTWVSLNFPYLTHGYYCCKLIR